MHITLHFFFSYVMFVSVDKLFTKKIFYYTKEFYIMNNTIIIVGKESAVCRISLSEQNNKIIAKKHNTDGYITGVKAQNRICTLAEVVNCLEQIDKKTELATPITIYTIDMVYNPISNGTPLFWFANDNKTLSGEALEEKETDLWTKFYDLYGRNITKVIFKSVSAAVQYARSSKFAITRDTKTIAEYIKNAWDDVDARSQSMIEDVMDDEI